MRILNFIFACILSILPVGCTAARPVALDAVQTQIIAAWQADQHAVWEIDWPAAPGGGPLTVEVWQAEPRYRYEILEATVPDLVGETLVFDGANAFQYNRFAPPDEFSAVEPQLSPVSDAFAIVTTLLTRQPTGATEAPARVNNRTTNKIVLSFADNVILTVWLEETSGLLSQVEFSTGSQRGLLRARSIEPLSKPAPELFQIGPWVYNG